MADHLELRNIEQLGKKVWIADGSIEGRLHAVTYLADGTTTFGVVYWHEMIRLEVSLLRNEIKFDEK